MYKNCLFILLDGARPDVIGNLLSKGHLPHFYRLFVERGFFTRAVSVFPSTTGPAYLPYLTGFYPGHCNVPGIRWFDRKHYARHSSFTLKNFRSYIGPESYLFNSDIAPHVHTLFEKLQTSVNVFSTVSRGVNHEPARFLRSLYALYARATEDWLTVDKLLSFHTRQALKKNPRFLFAVFPGIDELSHYSDPFSEMVMKAYHQFDAELGKMMKLINLDETLVVLASDHGLSTTHTHFDLISFLENLGYTPFYYPKILKQNFDSVVMQSGNAMAHLYVKKGEWENKNSIKDLEKIIEPLAKRREVAWVASLDHNGSVYVRNHEAEGWIKKINGQIVYVVQGGDPLQFNGKINGQKIMTPQESLELSFHQKYPDAFVQLLQLFESSRTGDIVVTAAPGYDLRSSYEWPEHRASHGSLHQEHMHVPLAMSHPLILDRKIRSVDVYPTILYLLGIQQEQECDGLALAA